MRITTAGHHALRIMLDLALHNLHAPVLRQDISERLEISSDYIAQIFRKLNKAGLIKSVMGPGGGYALARPAVKIRVGDILRAIEGPVETSYCVAPGPTGECVRKQTCTIHMLWMQLSETIDNFLDGITLQDLCERTSLLKHIQITGTEVVNDTVDNIVLEA